MSTHLVALEEIEDERDHGGAKAVEDARAHLAVRQPVDGLVGICVAAARRQRQVRAADVDVAEFGRGAEQRQAALEVGEVGEVAEAAVGDGGEQARVVAGRVEHVADLGRVAARGREADHAFAYA